SDKAFTLASGGTGVFQIDSAGTTLTLNGNIDGSGTLQKTGAGTLTLGTANTYTGGTTLSGGTLKMGANNAFGTSGLLTLGNGTLDTGDFSMGDISTATLSLSLVGNSIIKMGTGSGGILHFNGADETGTTLLIQNWTFGSDHIFIDSPTASFFNFLAEIQFDG